MQVSSNQYNPNFNARLISQWKCANAKGQHRSVSIIAFEKQDLQFIEKFKIKTAWLDSNIEEIRRSIIDSSCNTIKAVFENTTGVFEKVKLFGAVHDGKLCGLLVANLPKTNSTTDSLVYTTRHNPAKKETEIDWLVTWNPTKKEKLKGVGKAIVCEYFKTVKQDRFRDVFVRSEVPMFSFASKFYESLGFERLGDKYTSLSTRTSNRYVVDNFSDADDDVIPMLVRGKVLKAKYEELSKKMCRSEFRSQSVNIADIVTL